MHLNAASLSHRHRSPSCPVSNSNSTADDTNTPTQVASHGQLPDSNSILSGESSKPTFLSHSIVFQDVIYWKRWQVIFQKFTLTSGKSKGSPVRCCTSMVNPRLSFHRKRGFTKGTPWAPFYLLCLFIQPSK